MPFRGVIASRKCTRQEHSECTLMTNHGVATFCKVSILCYSIWSGSSPACNFDAFYIFTIKFSKSPARNFQTFQSGRHIKISREKHVWAGEKGNPYMHFQSCSSVTPRPTHVLEPGDEAGIWLKIVQSTNSQILVMNLYQKVNLIFSTSYLM